MAEECIEIAPGSYKEFPLEFISTDENGIEETLPITGATIHLFVKNDFYDDDEAAVIHHDYTEHTDPENGLSKVILSAEDTLKIERNKFYFFIIKLVDSEGHPDFPGIMKIKSAIK